MQTLYVHATWTPFNRPNDPECRYICVGFARLEEPLCRHWAKQLSSSPAQLPLGAEGSETEETLSLLAWAEEACLD